MVPEDGAGERIVVYYGILVTRLGLRVRERERRRRAGRRMKKMVHQDGIGYMCYVVAESCVVVITDKRWTLKKSEAMFGFYFRKQVQRTCLLQ